MMLCGTCTAHRKLWGMETAFDQISKSWNSWRWVTNHCFGVSLLPSKIKKYISLIFTMEGLNAMSSLEFCHSSKYVALEIWHIFSLLHVLQNCNKLWEVSMELHVCSKYCSWRMILFQIAKSTEFRSLSNVHKVSTNKVVLAVKVKLVVCTLTVCKRQCRSLGEQQWWPFVLPCLVAVRPWS